MNLVQHFREEFFPVADRFDRERGVQTSGVKSVFLKRLLTGREYRRYQGVDEEWFREAVEDLPRWTFIDVGCGRGKALILAHEAGFQNLIGVEFSSALCRSAKRNLAKLEIPAAIHCQDATKFHFPDESCIVFFYNPFGADLMQQVLANIGNGPRRLVYVTPLHHQAFNRFHLMKKLPHSNVYAV
jgi:SAM-dependent methyltransferase